MKPKCRRIFELNKPFFYIVDVFTEKKYSGNQLAVFRFTNDLREKEMQQIAREMNFSETTFIPFEGKRAGGYDVRIFTPQTEVPFAGHPTLGTAHIIQSEILKAPINKIILNLKIGQIPIFFDTEGCSNVLWMRQRNPVFGDTYDRGLLSKILSLGTNEIDDRFPVQIVTTGLPTVIVPVKTLKSVKRANVVNNKYLDFTANIEAKTLLVFCSETYNKQNDLNVRFFAGRYGIPEDPATGSGNGCLAGYLVRYRYFEKKKINLRVEQGYELGRPSLLLLKAEEEGKSIIIEVGGKVKTIAKGILV
jgi:trans-2,3-dihydro-3-hydroxyanthranilate isomerase